jgi:hypothetical protein
MSRIKAMGIAFVLVALVAVSFMARGASANNCGWGSCPLGLDQCYGVGTTICYQSGGSGILMQCTPSGWSSNGTHC